MAFNFPGRKKAEAEIPAPPPGPGPLERYAGILAQAIRADSAGQRLSGLSALASAHPAPAELAGPAGDSAASAAYAALAAKAIEEASDAEDLKKIRGSSETWYFSEKSMTAAYALHLVRLEERDPVRLIAETVRDESRIYPRPTDIRYFADPPFSMGEKDVLRVLGMMELRPDMGDIRRCRASNGALYLYSSLHLAETLAETLTEWIEVGQRENP